MNRISPLVFSLGLAMSISLAAFADAAHPIGDDSEFYEIRIYDFSSPDQHSLVADYWANAAIPGLKRQGIGPVGVFREMEKQEGEDARRIVVLIPYASLEGFEDVHERLSYDPKYLEAAAPYLNAEKDSPAYERLESILVEAFQVQPKLRVPDTSKPRIFEMREYEGHSELANDLKMYMFNDVEADIFAESGLTSVFYGKTLFGKNRPSLHYMVTFDDMEDHAKDWASFRGNARWKDAQESDKYKGGGLSGRSTYMLEPLECSGI